MWTDVDTRIAAVAARQSGLFTDDQARRAGATPGFLRHRLSQGQWLAINCCVYAVAGAPPSWRQRLLAAVLGAGRGSAVSHRAAAQLYGWPGFDDDWLESSVPRGRRPPLPRTIVHETRCLPRHHVKIVQGIAATS